MLAVLTSKELDERIDDWAKWAREPLTGEISSECVYSKEHLPPAADSAEMTDEVVITERAIGRTKIEHNAYWRVIYHYYIHRQPLFTMSIYWNVPESEIKRLFDEAKGRIGWHIFEIESGI